MNGWMNWGSSNGSERKGRVWKERRRKNGWIWWQEEGKEKSNPRILGCDKKDKGTNAGRQVGEMTRLICRQVAFEVKRSIQVKYSGPDRWNWNPIHCCGQQKCQQNIAVHHQEGCWEQSRKYTTNFCTWKSIYIFLVVKIEKYIIKLGKNARKPSTFSSIQRK